MKHYDHPPKDENIRYWKPAKFKHYLTLRELANVVHRDPSRIRAAEAEGKINEPARVRRGQITIRLYSPAEVRDIVEFFERVKVGRPKKVTNE